MKKEHIYIPHHRKRRILLIILVSMSAVGLLLFLLLLPKPPPSNPEALFRLEILEDDGISASGTALLVRDDRTLLCCAHLLRDAEQLTATDRMGRSFQAQPVWFDDELALLLLDRSTGCTPLELSTLAQLPVNEETSLTGGDRAVVGPCQNGWYSLGAELTCSQGLLDGKGALAALCCGQAGGARTLPTLPAYTEKVLSLEAFAQNPHYTPARINTLLNGGRLYDTWNGLYHSLNDGQELCYLPAREDSQPLGLNGFNLLAAGGKLYYANMDGLFQAEPDGTSVQKLSSLWLRRFFLKDGQLYLLTQTGELYCQALAGGTQELLEKDVWELFPGEDSFFYYVTQDARLIRRPYWEGASQALLLDDFARGTIWREKLYFVGTDGVLKTCDLETLELGKGEELGSTPTALFGLGDTLYLRFPDGLYRYQKNGPPILLLEGPISGLSAVGDSLWFTCDGQLWRAEGDIIESIQP